MDPDSEAETEGDKGEEEVEPFVLPKSCNAASACTQGLGVPSENLGSKAATGVQSQNSGEPASAQFDPLDRAATTTSLRVNKTLATSRGTLL